MFFVSDFDVAFIRISNFNVFFLLSLCISFAFLQAMDIVLDLYTTWHVVHAILFVDLILSLHLIPSPHLMLISFGFEKYAFR